MQSTNTIGLQLEVERSLCDSYSSATPRLTLAALMSFIASEFTKASTWNSLGSVGVKIRSWNQNDWTAEFQKRQKTGALHKKL